MQFFHRVENLRAVLTEHCIARRVIKDSSSKISFPKLAVVLLATTDGRNAELKRSTEPQDLELLFSRHPPVGCTIL